MPEAETAGWILLVDDDENLRHMLPRILRRAAGDDALHIETAANPEDALRIVQERCDAPLVVLSDFDLKSAIDGIDLLHMVHARCPSARRILYSGHPRELLAHRLDTPAIHAFHEKPDRLQDLAPKLLAHVADARRAHESSDPSGEVAT